MKVLNYDGLAWGPPTTRRLVDDVKKFPLHSSDVIVSAFPKSGTNWMQIMLANLYDDWGTCAITPHRRVPQLEYASPDMEGYEVSIQAKSPRLMKSHLPADRMPAAWKDNRAKVVYMTRNPKDVCVSFRHQLQLPFLEFEDDWEFWVQRFVDGKTIYGPWLGHVLGWRRYSERDGVLHVTYEETRADQIGTMRKVVAFLGKPVDANRFDEVMAKARFENMKESGYSEQINFVKQEERGRFLRKGKVADWKNWFSVAQNEMFDERIVRPLEAAGIRLKYE
jgi:hypothetical protein